jgi:pyruvate formate lyase activating enzyme
MERREGSGVPDEEEGHRMRIGGVVPVSFVDWPGRISTVIFTAGCNFKCPFCHNKGLTSPNHSEITEDEAVRKAMRKPGPRNVVVTGGEPTIHKDLERFLMRLRESGASGIKLDTNGSFPDRLRGILERKLVDYVAMDIKAGHEGYGRSTGGASRFNRISESVRMIKESGIEHEFRTTLVGGLHSCKDLQEAAQIAKGSKHYVQPYRTPPGGNAEGCSEFGAGMLEEMVDALDAEGFSATLRE